MPRYTPYTFRYTRYLWRFKLTPGGRFLFWSVLFTSMGVATVIIPVYQVFCVLLALYLVVWATNLMFRPKIKAQGHLQRRVTAGDELHANFQLTNESWRPAYDIMLWLVALPREIQLNSAHMVITRLGPGESASIPFVLRPTRRGVYALPDLRPISTFPFNLMRSGSSTFPLGNLMVIPRFHRIQEIDVPVGLRYQPGGVAMSSNVGESPEYIGNREYVPGEPAKRLDFRGWARLAKPVVREYQEEYYCRIALVLDTHLPHRRIPVKGVPQLEAAISLAASVADSLSATEHLIDLFAAGPELYVFRAGRQLAHFDNVLEILAGVEPCRVDPFDRVAPAITEELSSITTAVCILLDWDKSRELLARTIIEAGCKLKLIFVRDTDTTMPVPNDFGDVTILNVEQIEQGGLERI
jgi:uncharacterized protein (DUF58 family)